MPHTETEPEMAAPPALPLIATVSTSLLPKALTSTLPRACTSASPMPAVTLLRITPTLTPPARAPTPVEMPPPNANTCVVQRRNVDRLPGVGGAVVRRLVDVRAI